MGSFISRPNCRLAPGGVVSHAWKMRTARAPIAARITSLDVPNRVFIMPSGLAEQSPIYKHKVWDTLYPSATRSNSQRQRPSPDETDFSNRFSTRGNLDLFDVDSDRQPCGCAWIEGCVVSFCNGLKPLTRRHAPKGSTRELRECLREIFLFASFVLPFRKISKNLALRFRA